jgi:uncharacterized RDD family membrane protein YckC
MHKEAGTPMASAMDDVLENKQTQEFWLRRLIAIIIDWIIIYLPISIISSMAWAFGIFNQVPAIISGVLVLFYSALFEAELGYTIGKRIMKLEVVSLDGRPYDLVRGLIRNFSKIHGILLLLDLLGGIFMENRPNMRYLDTVANCEVVDTQVAEWRRSEGLTPPPGAVPGEAGVLVQTEAPPTEPTMPPEVEEVEDDSVEAPEPPAEDALQEVDVEDGAPGIPPPDVPAYRMEPPVETSADSGEEGADEEEEED